MASEKHRSDNGVWTAEELAHFEKRLMEIISHHTSDPLDTMLDTILTNVLEFSEAMQFDGWRRLNAEYAKQFAVENPV